jgi:hypothetical protein
MADRIAIRSTVTDASGFGSLTIRWLDDAANR